MKYIKLYEDLEFDPNNFRKLKKDIKAITIELVDNGFKVHTFDVEIDFYDELNQLQFDNYDYFVKIYKERNYGFNLVKVEEYIEMIKDYIDNYYTYDKLIVYYDGSKLTPKPYDIISQVEIEISLIKKK